MIKQRASGILLHITSLPSKYGIGDLGPEAYNFADFLADARQRYWQVLPLGPTSTKSGCSPYNGLSAFAGNTLLISPELLYEQGLLAKKEVQDCPPFPASRVDYRMAISHKTKLLSLAYERFRSKPECCAYEQFCSENKSWLDDFAVFAALRHHFHPKLWCDWPIELRDKKRQAITPLKSQLKDGINRQKALQYLFFKQWHSLKDYCNRLDIRIIGDIPIYVAYDSADVWAHPEIFKLIMTKKPKFVGGVPPDHFSRTGQLWGNPVYDWQVLKKRGYEWWIRRVKHNLSLFDTVRIDHFRGLVAYWQVPGTAKTAKNGQWAKVPEDFFNKLFEHCPSSSIIVEDLGYITPDVKAAIARLDLCSTKVLQFAFEGDSTENTHCPHNHIRNCVVYTGTHDNNTARGWFRKEATSPKKKRLFEYLGRKVPSAQIHWAFMQLAMSSVAKIAVIPMQDVMGLPEQARMNKPSTAVGNWSWRLYPGQITLSTARKLARLAEIYGRA